jgi:phosphoglycolate phosphatase
MQKGLREKKVLKYILFDLDGTLTDPKEGITKCVQYSLKKFGIQKECNELIEFIGPPLKEQFMKYANLSDADGTLAVEYYRERYAPIGIFENGVYDGVIEMLSTLKSKGYVLAIATSKPSVFSQKICDKYGISKYISYLSGSELDGRNTDKAMVIKNAMEFLGATVDNTIMVGDRIYDLEGAKANGISSIAVSYGYGSLEELSKGNAVEIVHSPTEIVSVIERYVG